MLSTPYSRLFLSCILIAFSLVDCVETPGSAPLVSPATILTSTPFEEEPELKIFFRAIRVHLYCMI